MPPGARLSQCEFFFRGEIRTEAGPGKDVDAFDLGVVLSVRSSQPCIEVGWCTVLFFEYEPMRDYQSSRLVALQYVF